MSNSLREKYDLFQKRLNALSDQRIRNETQLEQSEAQLKAIEAEVEKEIGTTSQEQLDKTIADVYHEIEEWIERTEPILDEAESVCTQS